MKRLLPRKSCCDHIELATRTKDGSWPATASGASIENHSTPPAARDPLPSLKLPDTGGTDLSANIRFIPSKQVPKKLAPIRPLHDREEISRRRHSVLGLLDRLNTEKARSGLRRIELNQL